MRNDNSKLPTWGVIAPDEEIARDEGAVGFDMELLEAELPADLAALAVQLQDDANFLANAYPAKREVAVPMQPRRSGLPVRWAAAMALVATLGSATAIGLNLWPAAHEANEVAVLQPREAAPPTPTAIELAAVPQPTNTDAVEITPPAEFTGFHDLTAPEQEALLDLLEHQNAGQASLSI